jgi:cell volume regulation protein A
MGGDALILVAGALLAASVAAALAAARLRLPALLLFLAVGVAVGRGGAGWVSFGDYSIAREVGIAGLALILFDGGLNTGLAAVKPVVKSSLRLAVGATVIVAVVTGVAASLLLRRPLLEGLLLGSILASTDSAAVFGLLRGSSLRRKLLRTLEGESALNDAVVLVLVLGFVNWLQQPRHGLLEMVVLTARALGVGAAVGILVGAIAARVLRLVRLPTAGLYAVASFAAAAMAYGGSAVLGGSGLFAVYLAGLWLGDAPIPARRTIAVFHDGLAWAAQVALFLVLGLLARPDRLEENLAAGVALALVVVLVSRPLGTFAMTSRREFTTAERALLSWSELVGATPLIFASVAAASGVPGGLAVYDLVFVAAVASTLLQGLTFEPIARVLGLTTVAPLLPPPLVEFGGPGRLGVELVEYQVAMTDGVVGRRVRDLRLPLGVTVPLIVRGEDAVSPSDTALIKAGDTLYLLVREEVAPRISDLIARFRDPGSDSTIAERAAREGALRDLTAEPWTAADGDPVDPHVLKGILVVQRLRRRRDRRGALVALEDGRYGVTGSTVAIGPADMVRRYARRRFVSAPDRGEAAWWEEVAAALRR